MKNNIVLIVLTILAGCSIATLILGFVHYVNLFECTINTLANIVLLFLVFKGFQDAIEN